ncbi:ribosome maturation factor RimM [Luedemannella helvata]|uniref:Ribosome maturation factor RimM n=1 Tax=Luedemannella helvata TaxID=349315 RepID=A0ABN2KM09_9ACTN
MLVVVGRVGRPHGIRGEVSVEPRTDEPEARFAAGSVLITDPAPAGPLTVASARPHQGWLLVAFEGIADRTVAEGLRGVLLCVDTADLPEPSDPDEFLDHQLIGLTAVDVAGDKLGEVVRVEHAPASDLLHVRLTGGKTVLVPFVKAIVPEVDIAAGRVVLTPPDGLFDL